MADSKKIRNITVGGKTYELGSGGAGDIYEELGITQERFIELLDRDFYVPDRSAAPDETVLTYLDTDGGECDYRIGQMCRVPDTESDEGYSFYMLYDITTDGRAVWAQGGGGGGGDLREKVRINLKSNQPQPDSALMDATVIVTDTTLGQEVLSTTWQGQELIAKVTPFSAYTVTVGGVDGYATPEAQEYEAALQGERNVEFTYNACAVTVTMNSNQADRTDIADAKATVSYGGKNIEVPGGGTVLVPMGASVTVSASEVPGYATPAPQTFTANAASKELSFAYNTCVLTVGISGLKDGDTAQATVSYPGGTDRTVASGGSVKVPYGVAVTVSVPEVPGYGKPDAQTFMPDVPSRSVEMVYVDSMLRITIDSNQTDKTDIAGLKATVSWSGQSGVQVASGASIAIPVNTQVTISFPDLAGYRKPDNITLTNTGGLVEKAGTYQTELVTVTVNADDSASVSGQKVTVNGSVYTYTGSAVTHKVPFGSSYSVSVDAKSGYTAPAQQSFTANQASRAVTMTYAKIKLGVFILHTNGGLYTADEWNTAWNANAVGVAVLTNEKKFVIAPTDSGGAKQIYNDYFTYPDLPQIGDTNSAKADLNGEANTKKMTDVYGTDGTYAADYCASYTFKNGKKGHLPSLGEWWIAYNNKAAIDTAMSKCGGTEINTDYHWSSTRASNGSDGWCDFWYLRWYHGGVNYDNVTYNFNVRAFSAF